ncbi:HAD-IA family hydrolase [Ferrimonas balearica]|uniref:HAD-IA family hydrolase n=1 Tax=Ferrimonas balearica TaxID=44012 RepID=UPI001F488C9F|nr:HAD-IA family hydrolase [Ferrimonas balearica]MBY6019548.1 HAD-IA family hydrolase [Halomonas denitrificans]MBY6096614.1 HAD-IA family hydrolase [Ferrimonas balearica]
MRFYRRLQPVQALSFDLDDTLYDNTPVLQAAERRLLQRLQTESRDPRASDPQWWQQQKAQTLQRSPELVHDTTLTRQATLSHGLAELGHPDPQGASAALMTQFLIWRSEIGVPEPVISLLLELAERYPLAVITNGNADVRRFLPQVPFATVHCAGPDGPQKPAPALFHQCCQALAIAPAQLLHIGDHPGTDVLGAIRAGCQAALLQPGANGRIRPSGPALPTLEFDSLEALRQWL